MEDQIVFVYGTLRKGCINHHYLEHAQFIGEAKTQEEYQLQIANYIPFMKKVGPEEPNKTNVVGELYALDKWCLNILDGLEGYDEEYDGGPYSREKIEVCWTETGEIVDAWAYICKRNCGRFVINNGDYKHFFANMEIDNYVELIEDLAERSPEDGPCLFPEQIDADC